MKTITTILTGLAFTAASAMADTKVFQGIVGDAANIQHNAELISKDLKPKTFDSGKVKTDIEALGKDIASLKKDVEAFDASTGSLSGKQKQNWELVKTKIQLITMVYDQKADLMSRDIAKNRGVIRDLAVSIGKRAQMLQKTARELDR